jgi:hypothetical protein
MALHAYGKIFVSMLAAALFLAIGSPAIAVNDSNGEIGEIGEATPSYELGQGLRLGESGFTIGGYTSLQLQDLQNSDTRGSLSHLSMFVWWEGESRLKFFSEIDSQNTLSADYQSEAGENHFLSIERLYFDYTFSDSLTLRAGKYLTPIGRWNQVHADPLVWTTSRPLITVNLFPDNATGLMALGNFHMLGQQADYTVYTSVGSDLRADPTESHFSEVSGLRLNLPANENTQFGLSYANFVQSATNQGREQLLGMDLMWSSHGVEVSGEGAYRMSSDGAQHNAKGGFLQGVVPLVDRLYAVGRIESISNPDLQNTTRLWVLGLNYRRSRAMSLKLEFIKGINQNISASGFLSSVSVLF